MYVNFKVLGLALLAIFAVGAVIASAASAQKEFHSAAEPTIVTGEQTAANPVVIKTIGGQLKCKGATLEGTVPKFDEPEITLHPKFTGPCTADGFAAADVITTGCNYVFAYEEVIITTSPGETHTPGPMRIECEKGKQIEITPTFLGMSACTITIPGQKPFEPEADHKVEGAAPSDVRITFTVEVLAYTIDGGGHLCGEEGLREDGFIEGSITTKGYESNAGKEGAQVSIWVN